MKDSRVGSYGVVGITLAIALKITLLISLPASLLPAALIVAHTASRALSTSYLYNYPYVQLPEHSKVGHYARATLSAPALAWLATFSLAVTIFCFDLKYAVLLLVLLVSLRALFGRYLLRRIGGITGDCLGATQQIAEVMVYAALVASQPIASNIPVRL
jgi:adenosylcobinamide-GDP ribazoletransferase